MSRLSNATRQNIRCQLIKRYSEPREEALAKQENDVAWLAINRYLGMKKDLWKQIPKEWLDTTNRVCWERKRKSYRVCLLNAECLPVALSHGHAEIEDHDLFAAHQALEEARTEHQKALSKLREQIDGTLNAVTTVGQLLKMWPEIAPFLPRSAQIINLPTVRLGPLNKVLGLTIVEKAAEKTGA